MLGFWFFANVDSSGLPPWVNYGVLGAVMVAFLTKQLVPGWLFFRETKLNETLTAEVKALNEQLLKLSEQTVPALREAAQVVNQAIEEIRLLRKRR